MVLRSDYNVPLSLGPRRWWNESFTFDFDEGVLVGFGRGGLCRADGSIEVEDVAVLGVELREWLASGRRAGRVAPLTDRNRFVTLLSPSLDRLDGDRRGGSMGFSLSVHPGSYSSSSAMSCISTASSSSSLHRLFRKD